MVARGRKRRSSQLDLEMAVEAVVAGASYKAAEEMTGVSRSTVSDYVVRSGVVRRSVPRRGRTRKLSSDPDVIQALVEISKGASQRQAATTARIGERTLRRCPRDTMAPFTPGKGVWSHRSFIGPATRAPSHRKRAGQRDISHRVFRGAK